jgi:hypothetical protein
MTTVYRVENQIQRCERFRVKILHGRGYRDVRSDRHGMPAYPFQKAAKNGMRVGAWVKRFSKKYPGLSVEVLKANGRRADGRMNIGTVRDGYQSN